jgi:hypothetical protein
MNVQAETAEGLLATGVPRCVANSGFRNNALEFLNNEIHHANLESRRLDAPEIRGFVPSGCSMRGSVMSDGKDALM